MFHEPGESKGGGYVTKDSVDLRCDGLDSGNTSYREESCKKSIFNQVLTPLIHHHLLGQTQ
jgi:hypothetical protein